MRLACSSFRSTTVFAAVLTMALAALMALVASPAAAKLTHPFERQLTGTCPSPGTCASTEVTPFGTLRGLATDGSDNLWVADRGQSVVDKFQSSGAFLALSTAEGRFGLIESLAFSTAAEHAYVADSNLDDLWVLNSDTTYLGDPAGDITGPWDTGPHNGCCFIRVAADNSAEPTGGDLYVSSGGQQNSITRIKGNGEAAPFSASGLQPYVSANQLTGPFANPKSLAVAPNGNLYVASGGEEGVIYEFEPSGELAAEFTAAGATSFGQINALAVDPTSGNLLIAEGSEVAPGTVVELSSSGALRGRIAKANGSPFGEVRGLAVDSTGRLYVADSTNHVVDVFGPLVALPIETDGGSVADVTSSSATLQAQISPNGIHTSYAFQYGTVSCSAEPAACTEVPSPPADLGSPEAVVDIAQHLTGLQPGTTYFYRLIATNDETTATVSGPYRSFTTQTPAPFALPDTRQWELVSPPDKHGSALQPIEETGVTQGAASGASITYLASGPTESGAQGNSNRVQVLSTHGPAGWASRDLPAPHSSATGATSVFGEEFRFFSSDLSQAVLQPLGAFVPSLSPEASEQTAFLRTDFPAADPTAFCATSCYRPLVTGAAGAANVPSGTKFGGEGECPPSLFCGPRFAGASPDASHVVLTSIFRNFSNELVHVGLTATPGDEGGLYEWSAGRQLELVSLLPGSGGPVPPSAVPTLGTANLIGTPFARNAISADGSNVIWSERAGNQHLYLSDTAGEEAETIQLGGEGASFQTASADGSKVFFTEHGELFRCEIEAEADELECDLTDLTPEPSPGEPAAVQGGVLGASEDGSSLYFVADGVLAANTAENGAGPQTAKSGQPNLYLTHASTTTFIATLSADDGSDWEPQLRLASMTSRVSPNGNWLAFMSERSLTGYDNRDSATGEPDQEVYLYHAAPAGGEGSLVCASCNPTGARPHGVEFLHKGQLVSWNLFFSDPVAANVPGWTADGKEVVIPAHQPRYLSDGGRLFFNASDALVPTDSNGTEDVYQFEPTGVGGCVESLPTFVLASTGCVDLVSSGTSAEESVLLDASESGSDVFFLTASQLSKRDTDTALDVYDARVGGGEAEPVKPVECEGDGCQQPAVPPNHPTPGTALLNGPGNVVECPKGKVKQKGKCVKQKSKKKHHKKSNKKKSNGKKQKRANSNRGGQK